MTAREVAACLVEVDGYLEKTVPSVPNPYGERWAEALIEAIEIIKNSKYWPDK